jgi:hypothetical protein
MSNLAPQRLVRSMSRRLSHVTARPIAAAFIAVAVFAILPLRSSAEQGAQQGVSQGTGQGARPAQRPAAPQGAQPQQAPTIAIVPPVVNLGPVEPGSTSPAKFTVINNGPNPVTVLDAKPNCKCTAINDVKGKVIPPGGMIELAASLAAPRVPGPKEAVVFLTFDRHQPMQAKIAGDVRFPILCDPPFVDALKEVTSGTIKVRSLDGKPFEIRRSGTKDPVFVGFTPGTDAPRAEYEIRWDLSGRTAEQMPLWWFLWTDRSDCAVIPLRVRDEATGTKADMGRFQRFWIVKESLVLGGACHNGTSCEVEFELEHYNPPKRGAIERPDWSAVKAVRSLIPGLEVKFVSKRDVGADAAMVKIAYKPLHGGMFEGELEIETATGTGRVPFACFATTW